MKGKKIDYEDEFYCTQCGGRQQFRIPRPVNQARATGHLKKMYCFNCNKEVNFVECKPYAVKYNHNDFLLEFYGKNFDKNGNRKQKYSEFKDNVHSILSKINLTIEDFIEMAGR